jgi:hypothetical protein
MEKKSMHTKKSFASLPKLIRSTAARAEDDW